MESEKKEESKNTKTVDLFTVDKRKEEDKKYDRGGRNDKYHKSHHRYDRRDNKHDREHKHDKKDYYHEGDKRKFFIKEGRTQSLNLDVLDSVHVEGYGIDPLVGKDLKSSKLIIDEFPEMKAISSSALTNYLQRYLNVDLQLQDVLSQQIDFCSPMITVNTYAQLPTAAWQRWQNVPTAINWGAAYQTFTTQKCVDMMDNLKQVVAYMRTNQSIEGLNVFTMGLQYDSNDTNPFWTYEAEMNGNNVVAQPAAKVLLGIIDGVNTVMLQAVAELKSYSLERKLIDELVSRHPTYATALKHFKLLISTPKFKTYLDMIKDILAQIPHDVEWVDKYSRALNIISKANEDINSPIYVPSWNILNPQYTIANVNTNEANWGHAVQGGQQVTYALYNANIDDGTVPFYSQHGYATHGIDNVAEYLENPDTINNDVNTGGHYALALLRALQHGALTEATLNDDNVLVNGGVPNNPNHNLNDMEQVVTNAVNLYQYHWINLANCLRLFKTKISDYIAFVTVAKASRMCNFNLHTYEYDYECEVTNNHDLVNILRHPEIQIAGVINQVTNQYPVQIAMYRKGYDDSLVDGTKWEAFSADWYWNWYQNWGNAAGGAFTPTLQYAAEPNDNAATQFVNANPRTGALNTLYSLPIMSVSITMSIFLFNSTYQTWRVQDGNGQYTQVHYYTDNAGDGDLEDEYVNIPISGFWQVNTIQTLWAVQNTNYYTTATYQIFGNADDMEISSYPTYASAKFTDVFGIYGNASAMENEDGYENVVTSMNVPSDYVMLLPLTQSNAYPILKVWNMQHNPFVPVVEPTSVQTFAQVPLKFNSNK